MIVTALTTLGIQIRNLSNNLDVPNWYSSSVTAFFFLSLAVNTLVTALIVYRIITVYNEIRGFNLNSRQGSVLHRDLSPLISILIESGLMTFVAQVVQTAMYKTAPDAFPLISGSVVMLYVRASCQC
jgi:hypothetical protein